MSLKCYVHGCPDVSFKVIECVRDSFVFLYFCENHWNEFEGMFRLDWEEIRDVEFLKILEVLES